MGRYPCTGMQRILCMELKILLTTSWRLSVPCSEMMMMDFLISANRARPEIIITPPPSGLIRDADTITCRTQPNVAGSFIYLLSGMCYYSATNKTSVLSSVITYSASEVRSRRLLAKSRYFATLSPAVRTKACPSLAVEDAN